MLQLHFLRFSNIYYMSFVCKRGDNNNIIIITIRFSFICSGWTDEEKITFKHSRVFYYCIQIDFMFIVSNLINTTVDCCFANFVSVKSKRTKQKTNENPKTHLVCRQCTTQKLFVSINNNKVDTQSRPMQAHISFVTRHKLYFQFDG